MKKLKSKSFGRGGFACDKNKIQQVGKLKMFKGEGCNLEVSKGHKRESIWIDDLNGFIEDFD